MTTSQLNMFDFSAEIVKEVIEHLPSKWSIPAVDVAAACDVPTDVIYAWWDEGQFEGWNSGTGKKRFLKVHRKSFIQFISRRSQP